jgi:hypothetical protein
MKYRDSKNPICQKTRDGRSKMFGIFADFKALPPCPKDVIEEVERLHKERKVKIYFE